MRKGASMGLALLLTLSLLGSSVSASEIALLDDEPGYLEESDSYEVQQNYEEEDSSDDEDLLLDAGSDEDSSDEEGSLDVDDSSDLADLSAPEEEGQEEGLSEEGSSDDAQAEEPAAEGTVESAEADLVLSSEAIEVKDGEYSRIEISGQCGDNLTFQIEVLEENGVTWHDNNTGESGTAPSAKLTISGTGPMYDYPAEDWQAQPWSDPRGHITEIVMEPGITHIGNWSFCWVDNLKKVTIPDTVTSIGDCAFAWCHTGEGNEENWHPTASLEEITIPSSVNSIGWDAFCDNEFLATINYDGNLADLCPEQTDEWGDELQDRDRLRSAFRNTKWYEDNYGDYEIVPDTELTLSFNHQGFFDYEPTKAGYYRFTIKNPDKRRMHSWIGYDEQVGEDRWEWHHVAGDDSIGRDRDEEYYVEEFSYLAYLQAGVRHNLGIALDEDASARTTLHIEYQGTVLEGDLTKTIHWEIKDGTLNVTGTGAIPDNSRPAVWGENASGITAIKIGKGITSVGANAFRNLYNTKTLEIPATVTSAGYEAFAWYNELQTITYPGKLVDLTPSTYEDGETIRNFWDRMWMVFPGNWMENNFRTDLKFNQVMSLNYQQWAQVYETAPNGEGFYQVTIDNPDRVPINTWIGYHDGREDEDDWHHVGGGDVRSWNEETMQEEFLDKFSFMVYLEGNTWYEFNARMEDETFSASTDRLKISLSYVGLEGSGTYSSGLTWRMSADGILTVSGNGKIPDDERPWDEYRESIKGVVLSEGVTSVGANAFRDLNNVETVDIPATVTSLGFEAFAWLNELEEVNYPGRLVDLTPATYEDGGLICNFWDRMWMVFPGNWMDRNFKKELRLNQVQSLDYDEYASTVQKAPNGAGFYLVTIDNPDRVPINTWIGYHDGREDEDDWHHVGGGDTWGWNEETEQDEILATGSYAVYLMDGVDYEFNARLEDETFSASTDRMKVSLTYVGKEGSGTYSSGLKWKVSSSGMLTISGKGEIPDGEMPWDVYRQSITGVTLSEGITVIGYDTLRDLWNIEDPETGESPAITIPSTVKDIRNNAFWNSPFSSFRIMNAKTVIDDYAFGWRYYENLDPHDAPYPIVIVGHKGSTAATYSKREEVFTFKLLMEDAVVKLATTTYYYDGKAKKPAVTVTFGGKTLKSGTDYKVTYKNNTKAGTATAFVTGIGSYDGKKAASFKILPANTITIANAAKTATYSTKQYTYKLNTRVLGSAKVTYATSNKNYVTVSAKGVVTVKAKAPAGLYTITITAAQVKNKYAKATRKATLTILPAKAALSSVTSTTTKTATLKWAKVVSAGGYQIEYSLYSNFKNAKTVKITKNSTVTTTIRNLTKGKTYYFRIKSYKTVSGKNYESAWSASKKVKIK